MRSWIRCCALGLVLLSVPALAGPPRDDRRAARIRTASPRAEPAEEETVAAEPTTPDAAAADASGVDLAGLLGMLAALGAAFVHARGWRLSPSRSPARRQGEPQD